MTTKSSLDLWHAMLTKLYAMRPPEIHADIAEPCDLESWAEFYRDMCGPIDEFIEAGGNQCSKKTLDGGFSKRQLDDNFKDQLLRALDGNATFVLEDAAAHLREENFQRMHHNRTVLVLKASRPQ